MRHAESCGLGQARHVVVDVAPLAQKTGAKGKIAQELLLQAHVSHLPQVVGHVVEERCVLPHLDRVKVKRCPEMGQGGGRTRQRMMTTYVTTDLMEDGPHLTDLLLAKVIQALVASAKLHEDRILLLDFPVYLWHQADRDSYHSSLSPGLPNQVLHVFAQLGVEPFEVPEETVEAGIFLVTSDLGMRCAAGLTQSLAMIL